VTTDTTVHDAKKVKFIAHTQTKNPCNAVFYVLKDNNVMPSVLQCCWLGGRKCIWSVKT